MAATNEKGVHARKQEMSHLEHKMEAMKVDPSAIDGLKKEIDKVTSDPDGAGGIVYCAVNKNGDLVFEHASGKLGKGKDEPMTSDTVFWIASCTKMITGIACMQLVEQGKLALDDADMVEKIAPVSLEEMLAQRRMLMADAGIENRAGSRGRKTGSKEEAYNIENVALAHR